VTIAVTTAAERADLWTQAEDELARVWPEYNQHGDVSGEYFSVLVPRFAHLQVLFFEEESERVVARGRTIPFRWDGTLVDLPMGIDAVGLRAICDGSPPTALSALAAEVVPNHRGQGLSGRVIQAMADAARREHLAPLLAPVRPSWKERYPLIEIGRYASWQRDDGLPFDPWMRVHVRLGGTVLRPEPRSMRITAPVVDWEAWTGLSFPDDGSYIFPEGLAPLTVTDGIGRYWEPNVWMLHTVDERHISP
jgi:GNAT superfamily N-acetyltransferase